MEDLEHSAKCKCPICQDQWLDMIAAHDKGPRKEVIKRGLKKIREDIDVWAASNSLPPEIEKILEQANDRLRPFHDAEDPEF